MSISPSWLIATAAFLPLGVLHPFDFALALALALAFAVGFALAAAARFLAAGL